MGENPILPVWPGVIPRGCTDQLVDSEVILCSQVPLAGQLSNKLMVKDFPPNPPKKKKKKKKMPGE
jgi:hypothetical protein